MFIHLTFVLCCNGGVIVEGSCCPVWNFERNKRGLIKSFLYILSGVMVYNESNPSGRGVNICGTENITVPIIYEEGP